MARPSRYPPELRERAVRLVTEVRGDHPTEYAAIWSVAAKLGITPPESCVRPRSTAVSVRANQRGARRGKRLRKVNAELRRAKEILKTASAFFASMPS